MIETKHCLVCRKEFTRSSKKQLYCGPSCNSKAWTIRHSEQYKAGKRTYASRNKQKIAADSLSWQRKNKEKIRLQRTQPEKHIAANLRSRLSKALKRNQKTVSMSEYLGCSLPELKSYLESKFKQGMTWDNYGKWHIDHIVPLSAFNLTIVDDLKKACHYTNLQPLWAVENLSKGDK